MGLKEKVLPYIITSVGVLMDWTSSEIGLARGFIETSSHYSPVYAMFIFFSVITVLTLTSPKGRNWRIYTLLLSLTSFAGVLNNVLVLLGVR